MKTLLCSDTHLRRRVDERYALRQLVDAAIKHDVKRFVAAGDLLDRQTNRSGPVTFYHQELDRLQDAEIEFHYLQGQHDCDDPPWLAGHRHAQHAHKKVIELGDYIAYALDFQPFGKLQEELAEVPGECDMLVAHQTWGDWMGDIAAPQGEFSQVPGSVILLYSGDLHQWRLDKAKNADGEELTALSTGAVAKQKIDEPDVHHYAILDGLSIKKKTLKSRSFIDWPPIVTQEDLTGFMEAFEEQLKEAYQEAVAQEMPDEMIKPRMRVTYSYTVPETVRRVTRAVKDRAILHWKEMPPDEKRSQGKALKGAGGVAVTPLTALSARVKKEDEPEVFELASRLLQAAASGDVEEEFQKWWLEGTGEK